MRYTVQFLKVRNVKDPVRGTAQAAGIDFFVPEFDAAFIAALLNANSSNNAFDANRCKNDAECRQAIRLYPGERILIPSGIKTYFEPADSALIAANKSGVATKKGLRFTAQVVDSDYTGEVHIGVANDSCKPVDIIAGEKLVQFLHQPVHLSAVTAVSAEDFEKLHAGSARGNGGFGSTGK